MFARMLLCALLMGAAGVAGAQSSPAPQQQAQPQSSAPTLTAQQRADLQHQNQVMVRFAAAIAQAIDHGQIGQVWDNASSIAQHAVTRDAFIKTTEADRTRLGTATSRKLAGISRTVSKGGKLPAGYYVNVAFATQFSKQAKPIRELVSFHLDSDKKWRLSGYTVR